MAMVLLYWYLFNKVSRMSGCQHHTLICDTQLSGDSYTVRYTMHTGVKETRLEGLF